MLKHYFKVVFRNMWKQRFYTSINVLGLAIGMACTLLITLYILDELSYDRFHKKVDRIYRLVSHINIGESEVETPNTSPGVAEVIAEELPEVELAVRMDRPNPQVVRHDYQSFVENKMIAADADFFNVFSFPLLSGDPATALAEPNSVVLTKAKADIYFPQGDALGNSLYIEDKLCKVTGIMEAVPAQSHFHFDIVYSFTTLAKSKQTDWGNINTHTYFLLKEGSSTQGMNDKLNGLLEKYLNDFERFRERGWTFEMYVQPLADVHLHSHLLEELEPNGNITNLYVFGAIALFIILIAGINFMNLATARSADRAKEVGVRKALGTLRGTLIRQFLAESLMMSLIAMLLALSLAELLRIPFNHIAGKEIALNLLENTWLFPSIVLFTIIIGLLAGSYPAFYLTRFQPVEVLRGRIAAGSKDSPLRNSLVVFQFAISIGLIVCTLLVYQQLQYIQNKELGFEKENLLILSHADQLGEHKEAFYNSMMQNAAVLSLGFSNNAPFTSSDGAYFNPKGRDEEGQIINYTRVSYDYPKVMGVHLKEGRSFSREFVGDTAVILVNEALVDHLGLENPVGTVLEAGGADGKLYTIVGVLENFHFKSLHTEIHPLILMLSDEFSFAEIKVQSENLRETIAFIENVWKQYAPQTPFDYSFLDEDFGALFQAEQRLGQIFGVFTGLAIFVACLGLLALAAFMAEQRTKEIGIRKVLGASVSHIVILLSKDFTKLVLIAFLIAVPVGYFAMSRWLENFAYRIDIDISVFIVAGGVAVVIAWLTVSYQSIKAALMNPVKSLRNE